MLATRQCPVYDLNEALIVCGSVVVHWGTRRSTAEPPRMAVALDFASFLLYLPYFIG